MNCQICTLAFTAKLRIKTTCNNCNFECCKKCLVTYIKSSNKGLTCMNCKADKTDDELSKYMSKLSINSLYSKVLKEYVFDLENKLLHSTRKQLMISNKKKELTTVMNALIIELGEDVRNIYEEKINNISLDNFSMCLGDCKKYIYRDSDENFYNCTDCNVTWCYKCEMQCDSISHKCDINVINSINSIQKETKPCPTCGIKIFKIDGCSQIMCSECNTFFDFNTGLQDKKEEPKHARNYIEMLDKFEIEVVGENLYKEFNENIKVCNNYDLWKNIEYKEIIRDFIFVESLLAFIINCKTFLRNNLLEKLNIKKYNELNRKDFINGSLTEKSFKTYSLYSYKLFKRRLSVAKNLTFIEFNLEKLLHKNVKEFNNFKQKNKLTKKNLFKISSNIEKDVSELILNIKQDIKSDCIIEYKTNDNKIVLFNSIRILSSDKLINIAFIDFCYNNNIIF